MSYLVIANIVGLAASVLLLCNHVLLCYGIDKKLSLKLSALGAFMGCMSGIFGDAGFLISLNVIWLAISLYGLAFDVTEEKAVESKTFSLAVCCLSILPIVAISLRYDSSVVGWIVAFLYIISFAGFSSGYMSRGSYIFVCSIAGVGMAWALMGAQIYTIAIKEISTALIGFFGLARMKFAHNQANGMRQLSN